MSLRKIDESIKVPDNLDDYQMDEWESLHCHLVTPLHGGGVKNRESDKAMPIRVTEIRGQLRFWWRLLAQHHKDKKIWNIDADKLREREFALWGGMGDDDNDGLTSLVFLRIPTHSPLQLAPLYLYKNLDYALFSARKIEAKPPENKSLPEMKLGKENLKWTLQWRLNHRARCYHFDYDKMSKKWVKVPFKQKKYDTDFQQVQETLRWWVTLGGIGGRTRRGCGALYSPDTIVKEEEMCNLGTDCKILFKAEEQDDPLLAWEDSVKKWKKFRREKYAEALKTIVEKNSRHLATVLSRPVWCDKNKKWRGIIIMLPNSSDEIKEILLKINLK